MLTYLLNFFIVTWLTESQTTPFLQVKVSVVNSAGGNFCWNYGTDTFYDNYADDNVLHLWTFWRGIFFYWYVGGSFCCNLEDDCFCCNYTVRSFWSTHAGDSSAAKIWVTIFVVIMQMGVSVGIMLVVFSAMYYAHDCFYCNYAGKSFF